MAVEFKSRAILQRVVTLRWQSYVLKLNFVTSGEFKFSGDFKICNTEDDGCTVETLLVVMFMHKIQ